MRPRLYVIPASPPCACIEAALRLKGVEYDVTELPNVLHIPHQLARFRVPTVPTMTLDGEKVARSTAIARRIDELWPEPPLYGRPGVAEAEAWAEDELQRAGRRIIGWAVSHRTSAAPSYFAQSKLPMPVPAIRALAPVVTRLGARRNAAGDANVRAELTRLPSHLSRTDRLLDDGVLGGEPPNAADLQVGSVLALLMTIDDVRPVIERFAGPAALARRLFPDYPGHVPAGVVPADWLP